MDPIEIPDPKPQNGLLFEADHPAELRPAVHFLIPIIFCKRRNSVSRRLIEGSLVKKLFWKRIDLGFNHMVNESKLYASKRRDKNACTA